MTGKILNKVRKGDVVALRVEHSETNVKMQTHRYVRWVLATVYEASRDGLARRVVIAGSSHSVETARIGEVFTIADGDKQKAAKRLIEATSRAGCEYETAEALKEAVRAALSAAEGR